MKTIKNIAKAPTGKAGGFMAAFGMLLLLSSCSGDQNTIERLQGKWNIVEYTGVPSSVIQPDSMPQEFEFWACPAAYTATCRFSYTIHTSDSTFKSDTLRYTVKGDEFSIVSNTSTVPYNFTTLFRLKRFTIIQLDEHNLVLERYDDKAITVTASK